MFMSECGMYVANEGVSKAWDERNIRNKSTHFVILWFCENPSSQKSSDTVEYRILNKASTCTNMKQLPMLNTMTCSIDITLPWNLSTVRM